MRVQVHFNSKAPFPRAQAASSSFAPQSPREASSAGPDDSSAADVTAKDDSDESQSEGEGEREGEREGEGEEEFLGTSSEEDEPQSVEPQGESYCIQHMLQYTVLYRKIQGLLQERQCLCVHIPKPLGLLLRILAARQSRVRGKQPKAKARLASQQESTRSQTQYVSDIFFLDLAESTCSLSQAWSVFAQYDLVACRPACVQLRRSCQLVQVNTGLFFCEMISINFSSPFPLQNLSS